MRYALIDPSSVDHETQRAAHTALAFARKELKLPMVQIKWFEHIQFVKNPTETFEDDKELRGQYLGKTPNTVYIKAGQSPEKIQETVLHEVFHLVQSLGGTIDVGDCETRTNDFVADAMRRMAADNELERVYLDHLVGKDWASERNQKEMDRRLGKPKAAAKKIPAARPEPTRGPGGYVKRTGEPARHNSDGSIQKKTFGRVER